MQAVITVVAFFVVLAIVISVWAKLNGDPDPWRELWRRRK